MVRLRPAQVPRPTQTRRRRLRRSGDAVSKADGATDDATRKTESAPTTPPKRRTCQPQNLRLKRTTGSPEAGKSAAPAAASKPRHRSGYAQVVIDATAILAEPMI